jgi:hypothetical protein
LFVAAALRERSSQESADLQLSRGVWGLCTSLIRTNLETYLGSESRGLVYVLKVGLYAGFRIVPPVRDFSALDEFIKDELRTEARFGFIGIEGINRLSLPVPASQTLLLRVLRIPDQAELSRRLALGMHRLTQEEYDEIFSALN